MTSSTKRPSRILLILGDCGPGDALRISPYLRAVRESYPVATIVLLVDRAAYAVFQHVTEYDRIVVSELQSHTEATGLARRLGQLREFSRLLRAIGSGYDLVITFWWGTTLLNALARLVGRRSIGYSNRLPRLLTSRLGRFDVEGDPYRQAFALLEAARVPAPISLLPLPLHDRNDVAFADQLLREAHNAARGRIVLHPGSDWACQQWAVERWAELADALITRFDVAILFTGVASEWHYINDIQARMQMPSVNLAGRTTLSQLGALVSRVDMCVCVDSVIYELTQAVGTPAVVLAGPTNVAQTMVGVTRPVVLNQMKPELRAATISCKASKAFGHCFDYACTMAGLRHIRVSDVLHAVEEQHVLQGLSRLRVEAL